MQAPICGKCRRASGTAAWLAVTRVYLHVNPERGAGEVLAM
jgi:hypothetical protein